MPRLQTEVRDRAVLGGAVIPDDNIAGPPAVQIGSGALRRVVDQSGEERSTLPAVHALDGASMRRDVERVAAGELPRPDVIQ